MVAMPLYKLILIVVGVLVAPTKSGNRYGSLQVHIMKKPAVSLGSDQVNTSNLLNNYPNNSRFQGLNLHFRGQKRRCKVLVPLSTRIGKVSGSCLTFIHSSIANLQMSNMTPDVPSFYK